MKIRKILNETIKKLKKKKIPSAEIDAELLLSRVINKPRSFLYIWPEKEITKRQETRYKHLIQKRLKGEPVAYLINNKEFYGLDFYVDKNVLIPRPETECLIDEALRAVKPYSHKALKIIDVGTGSGCIAVALKKYLPKAKVYASDISKKALAVARKNAIKHKAKIFFKQGNLLTPHKKINFNIIVANLPYLTSRQMKNKTIQTEPKAALFGGKDGLTYYRELLNQIKECKYEPLIFLEIDPGLTIKIRKMIKKILPTSKIEIKKDLSRRDRITIII